MHDLFKCFHKYFYHLEKNLLKTKDGKRSNFKTTHYHSLSSPAKQVYKVAKGSANVNQRLSEGKREEAK